MTSLSKTMLIGRVGRMESKVLESGANLCNFSVATTEKWKDKNGEKQEKTEWHNCNAWGKTAEIVSEYCKVGKLVYVEGQNETRQYEKDGETRYATSIKVLKITLLGSKDDIQNVQEGASTPPQEKKQIKNYAEDIPGINSEEKMPWD